MRLPWPQSHDLASMKQQLKMLVASYSVGLQVSRPHLWQPAHYEPLGIEPAAVRVQFPALHLLVIRHSGHQAAMTILWVLIQPQQHYSLWHIRHLLQQLLLDGLPRLRCSADCRDLHMHCHSGKAGPEQLHQERQQKHRVLQKQ